MAEQLIGRCTLITNSPRWLTLAGDFFVDDNFSMQIYSSFHPNEVNSSSL
ncbi:hypothetical protein H6G76_01315 [Nostoc sp. FACHB-152]|nr:hypothetical protein [Nostoc sp. FACHB-152]MBD2445810.1 hypothetical protein [Nostoc sp. FACHB-152]